MKPHEAIGVLLRIQERLAENVISLKDIVIILSDIMSCKQRIWIVPVEEVLKMQSEFQRNILYTVIIPSKDLHPVEEECLNLMKKSRINHQCMVCEEDLKKVLQIFSTQ
jgi:diphthamide biosynthesis methyltransferase